MARTLIFVVAALALVRITAAVKPLVRTASSLETAAVMMALIVFEVAVFVLIKTVFRRVI